MMARNLPSLFSRLCEHWYDWSTDNPVILFLRCNYTFYWEENLGERIRFNLLYIGLSHIKEPLSDTRPVKPQSIIFTDQMNLTFKEVFLYWFAFKIALII